MIVRRTGDRERGRVSARSVRRSLRSGAVARTLRAWGVPLPDPGGGFRESTNRPNPAPRPALRARRFRVREGDRGRYRAVEAPKRGPEAAETAKNPGCPVSWVGVQEAGTGALRFRIALDSSYYRLLSSPKPHIPALRAGHRPSEPMAASP